MTPAIHDIVTNREVIAIDQDAAGAQARRVSKRGDVEIWTRALADGSHAVAVFNAGATATTVPVRWQDVGITSHRSARDLWSHADVDARGDALSPIVPAHGVTMWRVQ
jgi:alpha-galactosidase